MSKKTDSIDFFDIPEEPQLNMLIGYSDCQNCYFRVSTLNRITQYLQNLHREADNWQQGEPSEGVV